MEEDKILIEKSKKGNTDAFKELILKYQARLFNLALYHTKNQQDASDLFQEAWLKAFSHIEKFDFHYQFYSWICRILINTYIDKYTSKSSQSREVPIPEYFDGIMEPDPFEEVEKNQNRKKLMSAVARLPEEFRITLVLIDIQQLSYEEVSNITKISIGTVRSRLSRAREKVRQILKT